MGRRHAWCLLACLWAGAARAGVPDDTRSWTRRDFTGGPVGRFWHYMTYAGNGKVLMMAGNVATGAETVTWFWDGAAGTWSSMPADPPPPAKAGAIALTFDTQKQRPIFFGGSVYTSTSVGDSNELWELDMSARQWRKLTPAGPAPSARSNAAFAYDPLRKRALLHGGYFKSNQIDDDWEWDGTRWTKLSPGVRPTGWCLGLVWMADRQQLYGFFGGSGSAQVWAWTGTDWQFHSEDTVPDLPADPALAYAGNGRVVAFGGYIYDNNKQTAHGDTFEWGRGKWTKVTTASKPSIREASVAVYDESRNRTVLYGGRSFPNGDTNAKIDVRADLWEYAVTSATTGTACDTSRPAFCASGFCVDGVCCGAASCGSCASCTVEGKEGQCAPLDPVPPACVAAPPDAAALPVHPDGSGPPPPDAGAPAVLDGAVDDRRDSGSTGPTGSGGTTGPPTATGGAAGSRPGTTSDAGVPIGAGGAGGDGSGEEDVDGGPSTKDRTARLYSGPACSYGGRTAGAWLAVVALAFLARRRRRG